MQRFKRPLTLGLLLLAIPAVVVFGALVFREKYYGWLALCVAVLSCLPLFYTFAHKDHSARELTVLAVMIALSVAGRFLFAWLPGFKPVTALTVIAAIYLGKEAGFAVGALSAVVSNFYFGQGPWTLFQMFAWGLLGFVAGLAAKPLQKSRLALGVGGVLAGVLFSLTVDVWTVLQAENGFDPARYAAVVGTSLPAMAGYALSNVVFLLLLTRPTGEKLERIKKKYGLFAVI